MLPLTPGGVHRGLAPMDGSEFAGVVLGFVEETKDANDLRVFVDLVDENVSPHDCLSVSQFCKLRVGAEREDERSFFERV